MRKPYISITVEKILNQYSIEAPPIDVEELAGAALNNHTIQASR